MRKLGTGRVGKGLALVAMTVVLAFLQDACDPDRETAANSEQDRQVQNYEAQVERQPAEPMEYSPTRNGLREWAENWDEPGKVAYIYFFGANGEELGYFVAEGLPTSYCASLTPPDRVDRISAASVDSVVRSAPTIDGAYYSGNNCTQFFAKDAVSGAYLEWTAGGSFNYFLSDQPLDLDMKSIGDATEENVRERASGGGE